MLCIVSSSLQTVRASGSSLNLTTPSLSDVSGNTTSLGFSERFRRSRWWTRGWTLQELLAPTEVVFFRQGDAEPDDQTLFAWRHTGAKPDARYGLLATSPTFFRASSRLEPYQDWQTRPPYQMTNRGLQIGLPMTELPDWKGIRYWAALDCPVPPDYKDHCFLAICLEKLPGSEVQFARVMANQFGQQQVYKEVQHIYVRQQQKKAGVASSGVFPQHVISMRKAVFHKGEYRAIEALIPEGAALDEANDLLTQLGARRWPPDQKPKSFRVGKLPGAHGAILFEREEDGERLLVRVGSAGRAKVGFDAIRQPPRSRRTGLQSHDDLRGQLRDAFVPRQSGQSMELTHHRVTVTFAEPFTWRGSKFILVDVEIEATSFARRTPSPPVPLPEDTLAGASWPVPKRSTRMVMVVAAGPRLKPGGGWLVVKG